ncbi:hypothetical protein [Mesorhizobium sp. Z1-4]|uniref:hypothetical protein n=1 Tax=Mesorhizobium sp. Z1-4 TaxID=2448478 RepID=UPI0013DEE963|nr:hypothetical protein [Mesorhizobium sp. Z1-4]
MKLVGSIGLGLLLAWLFSPDRDRRMRIAYLTAGLFFATFGTGPLADWAGLEFTIWQNLLAGLLAMTGGRLARRVLLLADSGNLPFGGKNGRSS